MDFKRYEKQNILLSVMIGKTLEKRIKKISEKEGINKSSTVRVLLEKGLEYYEKSLNNS